MKFFDKEGANDGLVDASFLQLLQEERKKTSCDGQRELFLLTAGWPVLNLSRA